jgi:4-alpha-glucanotransferase
MIIGSNGLPNLENRDPEEINKLEKVEKLKLEKIQIPSIYLFQTMEITLKIYTHFQSQVHLIGDIPIYINHDSADCWAHSQYFKLR